MLIKKLAGKNSFIALLILLGAIIVLVLIIFILVTSFPGAFGSPPPEYEIKEIYEFEPWAFKLGDLAVFYPAGGMIVPLYRLEKQEAVLIIGAGEYHNGKHALPVEEHAGMFVVINKEAFEDQRGDIIFLPVEDEETRREAARIYEAQQGLPVIWQRVIPLAFAPHGGSIYYYFLSSEGEPVVPPVLVDPSVNVCIAMVIYTLFIAVVLLVLYIFSLDHHTTRYWKFIYCARPGRLVVGMAFASAGLALGGELVPLLTGWPDYTLAMGYLACIGLLFILSRYKMIDFLDFGLRPDMARHGYLMAAAAAVMFIIMARDIPQNFVFNGMGTIMEFLTLFLLIGLARELIWRGYIQTTLGRRFGATAGLILTVILSGLIHFTVLALTAPWLLSYPYTYVEAAVLVPGVAAVLGFLYLRTENILSCALLHSLLLFLPRIIAS